MTKYLAIALAAACVLLGVQSWRLERVKVELHDARRVLKEWTDYRENAETDAQTAATECTARVDAAYRSAQRIQTIIERPVHVDPQGCAVRELVPSDELRDALSPPAGASPEPVH